MERNARLAGTAGIGSRRKAAFAALRSLLSRQRVIAVLDGAIDVVWVWEAEGLELSPGNERAINRQITKGKGKNKKKLYFSVIYS